MTTPDDRESQLPGLRRFGDALVEAAEQRQSNDDRVRRRFGRPALLVTVATLVVAAGAGAAALISVGEPTPKRTDAPADATPRGDRRVVVTAQDPSGTLPWGASIYDQTDGKRCIIAGRLYRGQLGTLQEREFRPYANDDYGACGRPAANRFFFAAGAARGEPDRALVFGRAGKDVRRLTITTPNGARRVPLGEGGAFLLVYDGALAARDVRLRADEQPQR